MSGTETRRLIESMRERFTAVAAQVPIQPFNDQLQAFGSDLQTVLLGMLARIETLENDRKKQ